PAAAAPRKDDCARNIPAGGIRGVRGPRGGWIHPILAGLRRPGATAPGFPASKRRDGSGGVLPPQPVPIRLATAAHRRHEPGQPSRAFPHFHKETDTVIRSSRAAAAALAVAVASLVSLQVGVHSAYAVQTTWAIDQDHSSVAFKVRHFFSHVPGEFDSFNGTIS